MPAVPTSTRTFWQILGPGMLYAAAAVGVSHLVQSTRAGADYGLGMTLVIVLACLVKYPSIRFGCVYATATGTSLIASYRSEGWWAFSLYALGQLLSMVFIVAAISLLSLGIIKVALGIQIGNVIGVAALLAATAVLLMSGRYRLLERFTKYVVAILSALILLATVLVIPQIQWSWSAFALPGLNVAMLSYVIAIMGWLPTPADGSVVQSLWNCERARAGNAPSPAESRLDFNVGYIGSVVLALCFMLLGAGVMHNAGIQPASANGAFSAQLIHMFTDTIGAWSFSVIAASAVIVMLSTLITVVDAMTRIMVDIAALARANPPPIASATRDYSMSLLGLSLGSVLVIATLMRSFATFVDLAAIIAFVLSPLLALLNHRAVTSVRVPPEQQPGPAMRIWSMSSTLILGVMAALYLYFRFA